MSRDMHTCHTCAVLHAAMNIDTPLTPEEALRLNREGGTVVCTGLPEGAEFGIGMRSYTIGPLFGGVKMVPPGIHLVTYGTGVDKIGLFLRIGAGDVHLLQWDPRTELLVTASAEDTERCAAAVRRGELDSSLGPYPMSAHPEWEALATHVEEAVLRRAGLPFGTFVLAGGIDDDDGLAGGSDAALQPYFDNLPRTAQWVQTDLRRVWRTDKRLGGAGLQGAELTRFFQDRSQWLEHLLREEYGGGAGADAALLGEMQLSFLLFLLISSLGALTQWKALLHTVCSSEGAIRSRPTLFTLMVRALTAQLKLAPEDLFVDELSGDNFLRGALASLADAADGAGAHLDGTLAAELSGFWAFLRARFEIDVAQLRREQLEEDDEAPVLVLGSEAEAEALGSH